MSYENEPLKLNSAVKDNNFVVPLPAGSVAKFKYFVPGNDTKNEDGEWDGVIDDEDKGTFHYNVPKDILTAGTWRTQPYVIVDSQTYNGDPDCFEVLELGLPCT